MNIFSSMMGGMISPEQKAESTDDTIAAAFLKLQQEFNLPHDQIGLFITAKNPECDPRIFVVKIENKTPKTLLREITTLEIVKAVDSEE